MKRILLLLLLCIATLSACRRDNPPKPTPQATYTELSSLSGIYYGEVDGAYNYFIVLSNSADCLDVATGDLYATDNQYYIILDLYASQPSEDYNKKFLVPQGNYTLDTKNSKRPGTLSGEYSYLHISDAGKVTKRAFEMCDVEVNIDGIYVSFTDSSNNRYRYHCGKRKVDNYNTFGRKGVAGYLSNLTTDISLTNCYAEVYDLEDYYVVGKRLWWLYLISDQNNEMIVIELLTPLDAVSPEGEYSITSNLYYEYLALPGYVSGDGDTWSWYYRTDDNDNAILYSPIKSGTVSVKSLGNGDIAAKVEASDNRQNSIYGRTENYN